MASVNFSVPDHVKEAFNKAFAGENKSAIIARLMQEAVEDRARERRRADAIDAMLALRRQHPAFSQEAIALARQKDRP